jgi:hypothetical protein
VVEKQLVEPLADRETRNVRFSRVYIPPMARRVRFEAKEQTTDGRGAEFMAFSIDERAAVLGRRAADESEHWRKDVIVGCVYPARDEVFIKRGDKFFGASLLLGKKTAVAEDAICHPAPAQASAPTPTHI